MKTTDGWALGAMLICMTVMMHAQSNNHTTSVSVPSPSAPDAPVAPITPPAAPPNVPGVLLRPPAGQYAELLQRVQQGDMSVDFRAFRIAGALVAGPHASAMEVADRRAFKTFMAASNPQGALDFFNRTLDIDYANAVAHFDAMIACRALHEPDEEAKHQRLLNALLDSIAEEGDGKAPETSYLAVTTQEEYIFMSLRLNVKPVEQSLITQNGHFYDRLKVIDPIRNTMQYFWFNADTQMNPHGLAASRSRSSSGTATSPVVVATAVTMGRSSDQAVKQYAPQEQGSWSHSMNIGVTRTDLGSTYHLVVTFIVPNVPSRSAALYLFNLVTVYGYQIQRDHRVDLPKDTIPPMVGDWKPGDTVHLEFDLLKEYADPSQGWNLRFCVGSRSSCLPSSNLLVDSADAPTPTIQGPHIRVENRSGVNFTDVVVNGKQFGDLKAGASTNYQVMEYAYKYARVSLSTDSGPLGLTPIDYAGERQLGPGNFTYVLTIQDGKLRIECVVD